MKKVGIMTFYRAYNYGAVLQAYALSRTIESFGYKSEIIDYSMNGFLELRKKKKITNLLTRVNRVIANPKYYFGVYAMEFSKQRKIKKLGDTIDIRNKKFRDFNNEYFHTNGQFYETHTELASAKLDYDGYVCGSDQIWNPYICELDSNYFLGFALACKKVAYAPSIGIGNIPKIFYEKYDELLSDFEYISVREKQGATELEKILKHPIKVVLDPTLLLKKEEWEEIIKEENIAEPYILNYFLGVDKYVYRYIDKIEEKYESKYKIVNLIFDLSSVGPIEMISLIRGASMIFTNSFHGMLMSINFNIPFVVGKTLKDMQKRNGRSRVDEIIESFGFKNRIWNLEEEMQESWESLDYIEVNRLLKDRREESIEFLKDALRNVTERE